MFGRVIRGDIVVIDSTFPQKKPRGFRNAEINYYLSKTKNVHSYAMYPILPDEGAWFSHGYGVSREEYEDNVQGYLLKYAQNKDKIHYLNPKKKYRFKLAYSFFLAETYVLLPFLETNKIPFVFCLYPGGAFGLHNDQSDSMLKRVCNSPYFRGVIATQPITRDYLLSQKLCRSDQLFYIYGGFVQFDQHDILPKKKYGKDKASFDICFVAKQYSEKGRDKGYDLFIEVAKRVIDQTDDTYFHVVGNFDETDIDISGYEGRIIFYGLREPEFLKSFYSEMDIFLSPNRPFQLYEGNFDGFPLGGDAGYCGVARFVADELNMNEHYKDGEEIVIIDLQSEHITAKIMEYYERPARLYELALAGQKKVLRLLDRGSQIEKRLDIFNNYVEVKR